MDTGHVSTRSSFITYQECFQLEREQARADRVALMNDQCTKRQLLKHNPADNISERQ